MERVIKFRTWDTVNKRMITTPMAICHDAWILFTEMVEGMDCNKAIRPFQQYVVMQFTGLLDANGKEMWEGDIVKMPGARQAMWVEYQPPAFVMRHKTPSGRKSESWSTFDLHFTECQFVEVIGNCYEHPHLLEASA